MPRIFSSRTRWVIPPAIAAVTVAAIVVPQAASGAVHPNLPSRTAAQVLADLTTAQTPEFSGTVVATSNLGLPSLPSSSVAGSSGAQLQQVETLLTGSHTIKIAYGGATEQRVAVILSDLSESDVVHNGTDLWTYASADNSVTHTTLPAESAHKNATDKAPAGLGVTPEAAATTALSAISPSTTVTVDKTVVVAGRSAYQLVLTPKDATSLVGSVRIAMDAATHLPLRTQIYSTKDAGTPAFQVGFTSLTLAAPSANTFAFTTPPGATTSKLGANSTHVGGRPEAVSPADKEVKTSGSGWGEVVAGTLPASMTGTTGGKTSTTTELNDVLTPVAGGRALNTALVSVLLTDDGRFLIGAVTPTRLQQLAASGLGK